MRLVERNDVFLLGGIAVALFAVFSRRLGLVLDYAHQIDQDRGLQLLPALVILAGIFIFHLWRKRQEERTEARQATGRAEEMGRLVAFGQALARSLDADSIRDAAAEHLPLLAPGRDAWTMKRSAGHLQPLTAEREEHQSERMRAASRALGEAALSGDTSGDVCFPLIVAGTPVGVLGVSPKPPLTEHQRSMLTAAAALLAVSIKNAELFYEVHENSVRDSLTGCFNRRHALEVMDAELRRARRSHQPLSLVMFDLDHFKEINDRHGHLCGDAVLTAVGQRMKVVLRGSDVKCRYGGEEFLVLLPDTPMSGAQRVADNLRHELRDHPVRWKDELISMTASFGITLIVPGELDALEIIGRADAALYRAKEDGRNCVRIAEEATVVVVIEHP